MSSIKSLTKEELQQREISLRRQYNNFKTQHLSLDMSRGKPGVQQLDLTLDMLTCVSAEEGYLAASGMDVRNYGLLDGLPEIKALFADILGVTPDQVIVGGNSSLNMMFDYISTCYSKGVCGHTPWCHQGEVKFLCPVPGYDRHFAITEYFGVKMIPVKMTPYGPKMEEIEELVKDPAVKGMWCVPMYSNPDGITYSDDTVRRLAALNPAAPDFRIIWDNAYCLHHLEEEGDVLLNFYEELKKTGKEDMVIMFTSTSKISFPGSGVAALAASPANVADVKKRMTVQTIGHDKLNMLRHIRFFKNLDGIKRHMKLHAAVLHPRFRVVLDTLETQLGTKDVAHWHQPRGGYFVSVNLMDGCAKRTIQLLKEAGVVMTAAGATFPYGNDPRDRNIRIAPSFPSVEDLSVAMELFCLCAELACVEKLLAE
ncbi:MAG: aminotransferase class I/II-fold pyridoxal phosphate-dependent enzyme [Clostridia bacterium]|nr:aminotransferase class I/II-fold pyridoxal phosphate-dependent enzyme [Clostridia bacterium]